MVDKSVMNSCMLTYLISFVVLGILINISGSKVDTALMNLKAIWEKIRKRGLLITGK